MAALIYIYLFQSLNIIYLYHARARPKLAQYALAHRGTIGVYTGAGINDRNWYLHMLFCIVRSSQHFHTSLLMIEEQRMSMNSAEFAQIISVIGIKTRQQAAALLNRSPQAINHYINTQARIPTDIAQYLQGIELWNQHKPTADAIHPDVARARNAAPERSYPRYRTRDTNTGPMKPYRMTRRQITILVRSLHEWVTECAARVQSTFGPEQQEHLAEHQRVKRIAAKLPRAVPYDVQLNAEDWPTCSRALLFTGRMDQRARSLYQTWRKNRYVGAPRTWKNQ